MVLYLGVVAEVEIGLFILQFAPILFSQAVDGDLLEFCFADNAHPRLPPNNIVVLVFKRSNFEGQERPQAARNEVHHQLLHLKVLSSAEQFAVELAPDIGNARPVVRRTQFGLPLDSESHVVPFNSAAAHWTSDNKVKTPADFLRTIYLGDRACKALRIESWNKCVEFEIDSISRIQTASEGWRPNSNDEIPNGQIVISGVVSIQLSPSGPVPNDFIEIACRPIADSPDNLWEFDVSVGSVAQDGATTEVTVRIIGKDVHLVDPAHPNLKIRD